MGLAALAVASLAPGLALADANQLYYERALMSAAGQRCNLFNPALLSALDSAAAQARGAALRSGEAAQDVDLIGWRARSRAAQVACNSPDLGVAAGRVRAAFEDYSHLQSLNFPGDAAAWRADRSIARQTSVWRLSQEANFGRDRLMFGLAGRGEASALLTAASFADGAQPYGARLVLRDRNLAPAPFLGGYAQAGRSGLAGRMPLRNATTAYAAEARDVADPSLLPHGATTGVAFRFPRAAVAALEELDPREAVAIDFLFEGSGGESVRTAYIEVGDFAAGHAFLLAVQR